MFGGPHLFLDRPGLLLVGVRFVAVPTKRKAGGSQRKRQSVKFTVKTLSKWTRVGYLAFLEQGQLCIPEIDQLCPELH